MCDKEETAIYTSKWSKSALDNFIELFNSNRVETLNGDVIKIIPNFFGNEFTFSMNSYTQKYYNENSDKILREINKEIK